MRVIRAGVVACMAVGAIGCGPDGRGGPGAPTVDGARIGVPADGAPGEWAMPAKDYAGSRFSTLSDITPATVARLALTWTFSTGVLVVTRGRRW